MKEEINPKVFISYAWSKENKEKVISLGTKLRTDGVNVKLDLWDLKQGHDKYVFMESMVTDPEISKVLIICDRKYTDKANAREGGVGNESQIISPEIYGKCNQDKFIPILIERDEKGNCIPAYLSSRIYIEYMDESEHEGYDEILRNIYGKPLISPPPLGNRPNYLDNEDIINTTISKFSHLSHSIKNNDRNLKLNLVNYLDEYYLFIKNSSSLFKKEEKYDENVYQSILSSKSYLDQFDDITNLLCKYNIDFKDEYFQFFEKLVCLITQYPGPNLDNIQYISKELFLHNMTFLIVNNKFELFNFFITNNYFSTNKNYGYCKFTEIGRYIRALDDTRKNRLNSRHNSLTAELIKERCPVKYFNFNKLIETDFILSLRALFIKSSWTPYLSIYNEEGSLEIFLIAEDKNYFNKIKTILDVTDKVDLILKVGEVLGNKENINWKHSNYWYSFPLPTILNLENLSRI